MPFAGLAFGLAAFAAIGLPGFANFAARSDGFLRRVSVGADWQGFHIFQIATVLALVGRGDLGGLHAARLPGDFHGRADERWSDAAPIFARILRLPIILLIAATLWSSASFPTPSLRLLRPTFAPPISRTTDDPRARARNRRPRPGACSSSWRKRSPSKIDKRVFAIAGIVGLVAVLSRSFFLAPPPPRRCDRFLEFLHG